MLVSVGSVPLWAAIVAEVAAIGLTIWRMICILPASYRFQVSFGPIAAAFIFNLRDRSSHFGPKSAGIQLTAISLALVLATLNDKGRYRQALAPPGNADAESRRSSRKFFLALSGKLLLWLVILLTTAGVLIKGAM
jgi:hypothetical protein